MIKGYGFSIWYIPYNYQDFQNKYKIIHIPHVTYQTNFEDLDSAIEIYRNLPADIDIDFNSNIVLFPQMYSTDPLCACGFYVKKSQFLNQTFEPHLSTKYFDPFDIIEINRYLLDMNQYDKPLNTKCFKAISDNQNLDWTTWDFKKY